MRGRSGGRGVGALAAALGCAALLTICGSGAATHGGSSIRITENLAQKVVTVREKGESLFEVVSSGRLTVSGTLDLTGVDIGAFGPETPVEFDILALNGQPTQGDEKLEMTLGDDPRYRPGKKSARITVTEEDDKGNLVVIGQVKLQWTAARLTYTVTDPNHRGGVFTEPLIGAPTGPAVVDTHMRVLFDTAAADYDVRLTGRVKTVVKRVGRGEDAEEFELTSATLSGKAGAR